MAVTESLKRFLPPALGVTLYYAALIFILLTAFDAGPETAKYVPIGGVDKLATDNFANRFEARTIDFKSSSEMLAQSIYFMFALLGAVLVMVPVAIVHKIVFPEDGKMSGTFMGSVMILPVVVTGIVFIVQHSLALAFSLAGVVAAVRFRFTLRQPSDAMYIFVAIAIGLGSGIGALGVAGVISFAFVMTTLVIWKLEYGKTLAGPFLTMITRRDAGEDEYD